MAKGTRGTRGSEAIEFAIILPALLMFVVGLMDTGRLLWVNGTLAHAVAAAARCAAINATTCGTSTAVQAYAVQQAWPLGLASSAFTVTAPACGSQVAGTLSFSFLIPWSYVAAPFGVTNAMTLNAVACYPG